MKIIKKLWLLVALAAFSLVAAFTAAGFLQAGLSLPTSPPLFAELDNNEARPGLLNGYKGYRHHRAGFRRHNDGWWYPREAFGDFKKEEKREKTQDVSRLVLSPMKEMEEKKEADIAMIAPLSEPPKLIAPQTIVQEVVETQVVTKEETPKIPTPQKLKSKAENATKQAKQAKQAQAKGERSKRGKLSAKHVTWCAKKYRSYRAADNMFQPLKGKRKACRSPYS